MLKATLAASAQPRRATGSDPLDSQCEAAVPPYSAPLVAGRQSRRFWLLVCFFCLLAAQFKFASQLRWARERASKR